MKKYCLFIFLILIFLFPAVAFAQAPEIEITSPKENEVIKKDYLVFSFKVRNFVLKDYHLAPPSAPGEGHLHICLDTEEVDVGQENCREHIFLDDEVFSDLEAGDHFIVAELVANDHQSFSPLIKKTVDFKITAEEPLPRKKTPSPSTPPLLKTPQQLQSYKTLLIILLASIVILVITLTFLTKKGKPPKKSSK